MTHLIETIPGTGHAPRAKHHAATERREAVAREAITEPPPFRYSTKPQSRLKTFFFGKFVTPPRLLLWAVRELPMLPLPWKLVGRYDEVLEVLSRPEVFGVPFNREMARLNDGEKPGTQFILGEDDPKKHDEQLRRVMQAFPRATVAKTVAPLAFKIAGECVHFAGPTFDAVKDLITKVALQICVRYYGVTIDEDSQKFIVATMTTSGHLFGPPPLDPKDDKPSDVDRATAYFRHFVDRAIRAEESRPSGDDTVVACMVADLKPAGGPLARDDFLQIRAFLMDMIVGFIPTSTLAAGHMLEGLLDHPEWLDKAYKAADAGDDILLERVLFEALRFMPINPGPFRIARKDHVLAEGTPRATRIKKGSIVWAMTFAAMFDPRHVSRPKDFLPERSQSDHLHLGFGMHSCAGLFIARAHVTQTFKALLIKRKGIKRASPMRLRGGMPIGLDVSSMGKGS